MLGAQGGEHDQPDQLHHRHAEVAAAGWKVWVVKLVSLAIISAASVFAILSLLQHGSVLIAVIVAIATIAINIVYLVPGLLPAKYLTPGLVFLIVYQIVAMGFTAYIAFTNFGSGHNSTKEDAVAALLQQSQHRVEESATYPVTILEKGGDFFLLTADPDTGDILVGGADQPLEEVDGATRLEAPGYTTLDFSQVLAHQDEITALAVPLTDDPNDGALRTTDGSNAYVYVSTLAWDPDANTMTDTTTGTVYSDSGRGAFTSPRITSVNDSGASSGISIRTTGVSLNPGSAARSSRVLPRHSRSYPVTDALAACCSARSPASRSVEHQQ